MPETEASTRAAWDILGLLRIWIDHLHAVDDQLLVEATPSRGRTVRELTVNAFHPVELLPSAWETGVFDWYPERDAERTAELEGAVAVRGFAQRISDGWNLFLLDAGADLDSRDPLVGSPRGALSYSTLLTSQRWHVAFHYRQVKVFLETRGVALPHALPAEALEEYALPGEVF